MKIDQEKLKVATVYVNRMAEGKNPVYNTATKPEDVLNNPNIIRCMYFIRDVLYAVAEQGGEIGSQEEAKAPEPSKHYPFEVLEGFVYKEDLSITHFLNQLLAMANDPMVRPLTYYPIIAWFKDHGYLEDQVTATGQKVSAPTRLGKSMGIYQEHRKNFHGEEYDVVMYGKVIQEFMAKNLKAIILGKEIPLPVTKGMPVQSEDKSSKEIMEEEHTESMGAVEAAETEILDMAEKKSSEAEDDIIEEEIMVPPVTA